MKTGIDLCFYYFFDRFIGVTLPMGRLISR